MKDQQCQRDMWDGWYTSSFPSCKLEPFLPELRDTRTERDIGESKKPAVVQAVNQFPVDSGKSTEPADIGSLVPDVARPNEKNIPELLTSNFYDQGFQRTYQLIRAGVDADTAVLVDRIPTKGHSE